MRDLPDLQELVCGGIGNDLFVSVSDAARLLKRCKELLVEVERQKSILANVTSAILSYGPSQPLGETNLFAIARNVTEAVREKE
jgi:hypothetical protein